MLFNDVGRFNMLYWLNWLKARNGVVKESIVQLAYECVSDLKVCSSNSHTFSCIKKIRKGARTKFVFSLVEFLLEFLWHTKFMLCYGVCGTWEKMNIRTFREIEGVLMTFSLSLGSMCLFL